MNKLKRILLAEDDPNDVELTVCALAAHNLVNEVVVARDGAEVLDYVYRRGLFAGRSAGNPVVILLDLKMPRVGGLEVIRQLKGDERTRRIPVVVLTSSREEFDLTECYSLGANAYVVKPVKFGEFAEVVKNLGVFWAMITEPPPGDSGRTRRN